MAKYSSDKLRVYFGGYNPGTHTTSVSITLSANALDNTALVDSAERILTGHRTDQIEWAGWYDDDAQALDNAMKNLLGSAAGTNQVVSVHFGSASGGAAYCGTAMAVDNKIGGVVGELAKQTAIIRTDGALTKAITQLADGTYTNNGSFGVVDHGGTTTAGATAFAQFIKFTVGANGEQAVYQLQDSADNNTYAALGTCGTVFSSSTSSTSAILVIASGTNIDRYTRGRVLVTGGAASGSVSLAVALHRVPN